MPTLLDTEDFQAAKDALERAKQATDKARQDRLSFLEDALIRAEAYLARVKQRALELPALIANYRAEIARLEATTGADILREAMDALKAECWGPPGEVVEVQSPKPQPEAQSAASAEKLFMPGLPPEALRKVWPEWQDEAGDVVTFKDEQYRWAHWHSSTPSKRVHDVPWNHLKLRPHGATQAHVEALAQQAQTPKPHACPRCDEGMREVEITQTQEAIQGLISVPGHTKGDRFVAHHFETGSDGEPAALRSERGWRILSSAFRFTRPDVPPPSEWCDGSGKGGAE